MIRHVTTLSMLALIASCASQPAPTPKPAFDSSRNPDMLAPDLYPNGAVPEKEPVVRYGRYTLVSTLPDSGQRDLMAQIIDVSIPANMKPNVRDAMQYVVDRSGYTLCSGDTGHVGILYSRPLPAAQYKLGPMTLRNTLQVLAGPAWQVKVDEVSRQVCYVLRPGYQLPETPRTVPTQIANSSLPTTAGTTTISATSGVVVAAIPASAPITGSTASAAPTGSLPLPKPATTPVVAAKDGTLLPATSTSSMKQGLTSSSTTGSTSPQTSSTTKSITTPANSSSIQKPTVSSPTTPKPLPQIWAASTGSTLRQTVEAWATTANWKLIWKADDLDYPIDAPLRFEGSFEQAIKDIFPLYDTAPRSFVVDLFSGNSSQRVIYIAERKK